jgi:glyoxylase-like metal-dependent hydrolase (beta-lactamase superfamily II)
MTTNCKLAWLMSNHTNQVDLIPNQGWDQRILVCRNGDLVDTFIVVTQRYVVLVDTVINPATAAQMVAYAQPYLQQGRQLLVVNTHADYDHAWGNQLFAGPGAIHPAPIIASRLCDERLRGGEALASLQARQAQAPEIFGGIVLTPPTICFDGRLTIDGGDLTLELLPAPGHTEDQIVLFLPEIGTLLAADAVELPFPLIDRPADLPILRQTLAQLAALNPATALYCHAPVTIGPQLIHDNIAYFDRLEQACRAALAIGAPAHPAPEVDVVALVKLPYTAAVPDNEHWRASRADPPVNGHPRQIRLMLAWLGKQGSKVE